VIGYRQERKARRAGKAGKEIKSKKSEVKGKGLTSLQAGHLSRGHKYQLTSIKVNR